MKNNNKTKSYWFISSILITILGAMSILMIFLMQFYETRGIFFWTALASWIIILILIAIIFCVHDSIEKKQNDIIKELQKTIGDLKKDKSSE